MGLVWRLLVLGVAALGLHTLWWAQTQSPQAQRARSLAGGPCELKPGVVKVKVSVSRYPENWRHIVDARSGRNTGPDGTRVVDNGLKWPIVLTVHRAGADDRRDIGMRMSGLRERAGKARDEYPPAFARTTNSADFRYVDHDANSGQGASMGNQLRGKCDGQRFRLVAVP